MCKRFSYCLLLISSLFLLCGCRYSITSIDDSVILVGDIEYTDLDTVMEDEFCIYSDKEVKGYLSEYSYMSVTQSSVNGIYDGSEVSDVDYLVEGDTKNKLTLLYMRDGNTTICDWENNLGAYFNEDMWHYIDGSITTLSWDMLRLNSAYDMYLYFLKDTIFEGVNGVVRGDYYYYEIVTDATVNDINGVYFDELGSKTVQVILKDNSIPCTIISDVSYTYEGVTHYSQTTLQITEISNKELMFPVID